MKKKRWTESDPGTSLSPEAPGAAPPLQDFNWENALESPRKLQWVEKAPQWERGTGSISLLALKKKRIKIKSTACPGADREIKHNKKKKTQVGPGGS